MANNEIRWTDVPRKKDFESARAFLTLTLPEDAVDRVVARLSQAPTIRHQPKDLERASGMKLLPPDDPVVSSKPRRSRKGRPLSPVLLVRGRLDRDRSLVIADGFHRICASYHVNRKALIPCRLVDLD